MKTKIFSLLAGLTLLGAASSASAVVVDFQDLSSGNCGYQGNSGVVSRGYEFQGNPNDRNLWVCNPGVIGNNPTAALIDANTTSLYTMTKAGGGTFTLQSFFTGARFGQLPTGMDIIGTLDGGGTVTQQHIFNGFNWDQVILNAGFSQALTSVTFDAFGGNSSEFLLDDLVVNEISNVPAPAGMLIFGFALVALGLRRRS